MLTIESDDNVGFGTPIVRATFGAVTTAPNRDVKLLAGAVVDDWWRAVMTKTGGTSLVYAVTLGIVNL